MALYQSIMNVPGLSGTSYERQKQYFNKLGGTGNYVGSASQNNWLLSQLGKANFGLPQITPVASTPQTTAAQALVTAIPTNNTTKSFRELLPENLVVNQDLLNQFAEEQVNPDAYAQASQGYRNTLANLYSQGGQRFGQGRAGVQDYLNSAERARQDQLSTFRNSMTENLKNQYREMEQQYYSDPNSGMVNEYIKSAPNNTLTNLNTLMGTAFKNNPLGSLFGAFNPNKRTTNSGTTSNTLNTEPFGVSLFNG